MWYVMWYECVRVCNNYNSINELSVAAGGGHLRHTDRPTTRCVYIDH